jgi:lipoate-protein ligase A
MLSSYNKLLFISPFTDPFYNLAAEEYFVRNLNTENTSYLFVYQNAPSIVVGKNQNVYEEIHWDTIKNQLLPIARRVSGGGTVVHDMGNLNFSFIQPCLPAAINNYSGSSGLLAEVLNQLGINCYLNARNAIMLSNERKISGSAQFTNQKNILSHCTLLVNADLELFSKVLKKNSVEILSKSSKSVRSPIENLSEKHSALIRDIVYFRAALTDAMGYSLQFLPDSSILEKIQQLADGKYRTTSWNIDRNATCNILHNRGSITLEEGIIQSCEFDKSLHGRSFKEILEQGFL